MELRARLLGSWHPISGQWCDERGDVDSPFGKNPAGLLTYDAADTVSAQLMRRDRPHFAEDDWRCATAEERAAAWGSYFCYFGTYTVDEEAGTVTHHVEGSSFPNMTGTDQVRYCALWGNCLSLSAETPWGRVVLVWQKI
jgi:Lipocalin-like domain